MKSLKIKIIFLALGLSSLCFGENIQDNDYTNLVNFSKEYNFAKFKELYSKANLSAHQKYTLLKNIEDSIEIERSNWSQTSFYKSGFLDISNVKGSQLKMIYKMHGGILGVVSLIFMHPKLHLYGYAYDSLFANWVSINGYKNGIIGIQNGTILSTLGLTAAAYCKVMEELFGPHIEGS